MLKKWALAILILGAMAAVIVVCSQKCHADPVTSNSIIMEWVAPGDNGATGTAASYQIRYSKNPVGVDTTSWWNAATPVTNPPLPAASGTTQSLTLSGLLPSTTYYGMIVAFDEVGNSSGYSNVASIKTLTDSVSVTISNIIVTPTPNKVEVKITWTTDIVSNSQVEYGGTLSYGNLTPLDTALVTSHSVTLTNPTIINDVTYNFRVRSQPAVGTIAMSNNLTFKVDVIAPFKIAGFLFR